MQWSSLFVTLATDLWPTSMTIKAVSPEFLIFTTLDYPKVDVLSYVDIPIICIREPLTYRKLCTPLIQTG